MEERGIECEGGVNPDEQGGNQVLPGVRPASQFVYAKLRIRSDGRLSLLWI